MSRRRSADGSVIRCGLVNEVGRMTTYAPTKADPLDTEAILSPLSIGRVELKNRLIRSSISGRIDNYDGSGTPARVNFEERFARGGVGAIISSHVPITPPAPPPPH